MDRRRDWRDWRDDRDRRDHREDGRNQDDRHDRDRDRDREQPQEPQGKYDNLRDAVDWAQENLRRVDFDGDGRLDHSEVRMARFFNSGNGEDQEALKTLDENFRTIAASEFSARDHDLESITMGDLNKFEGNITRFERADDIGQRLLEQPGLFNLLDGADDGGKTDGKISKGDLEKYLRMAGSMDGFIYDEGPFSRENIAAVRELYQTWDQNYGAGKLLRNGEKYITRGRIQNYHSGIA